MQQWIIPCNINLYHVISAFKKLRCIDWKQSNDSSWQTNLFYPIQV